MVTILVLSTLPNRFVETGLWRKYCLEPFIHFQVIEKFIRYAYRERNDQQNLSYATSTFMYAIAVSIFAIGGMCGGFIGGWIANKFGR